MHFKKLRSAFETSAMIIREKNKEHHSLSMNQLFLAITEAALLGHTLSVVAFSPLFSLNCNNFEHRPIKSQLDAFTKLKSNRVEGF